MKDTVLRFYLVEHIALMLVAIILITVGYVKAKKKSDPVKKNRTILIYYAIGLILILVSIPWPFRGLGAGWF
jgi:membrane protein DedA with SNARE-associated domain